ncbi:MAG: hypothetical protein EPO26_17130 [Chloroflexota bacterium]|nr:MAG: hypothetical protein EPO26_17130 [Chloroflexota bacterium]
MTIAVSREAKRRWVSRCEELNIASCGSTIDEAMRNVEDAIEVYMETLDEAGEADHVLAMKELHPMWRSEHLKPKLEPNVFRTALVVDAKGGVAVRA